MASGFRSGQIQIAKEPFQPRGPRSHDGWHKLVSRLRCVAHFFSRFELRTKTTNSLRVSDRSHAPQERKNGRKYLCPRSFGVPVWHPAPNAPKRPHSAQNVAIGEQSHHAIQSRHNANTGLTERQRDVAKLADQDGPKIDPAILQYITGGRACTRMCRYTCALMME